MLITFSGLDGAGKSTLIAWLADSLREEYRRPVVVFHMNDHVGIYAYIRKLRNLVLGERQPETHPLVVEEQRAAARAAKKARPRSLRSAVGDALRYLRYRIIWNSTLRRLIYPIDLLVFLCYRTYNERIRGRVLIMDRYFYDTLVDVSTGRRRAWAARMLERITPTPTLPIYLDITPEESFARKGEYSVEYLRRRQQAYRRVVSWVPSYVVIPTSDLEASKAVLHRAALERLGAA